MFFAIKFPVFSQIILGGCQLILETSKKSASKVKMV